jgi:hypothetical protein
MLQRGFKIAAAGYPRDGTIVFFVFCENNIWFIIRQNRRCGLQRRFKTAGASYSGDSILAGAGYSGNLKSLLQPTLGNPRKIPSASRIRNKNLSLFKLFIDFFINNWDTCIWYYYMVKTLLQKSKSGRHVVEIHEKNQVKNLALLSL